MPHQNHQPVSAINATPKALYGNDPAKNESRQPVTATLKFASDDVFITDKLGGESSNYPNPIGTRVEKACFGPSMALAQTSARILPGDVSWWIAVLKLALYVCIPIWAAMAIKTMIDGEDLYEFAYAAAHCISYITDVVASVRACVQAPFQILMN